MNVLMVSYFTIKVSFLMAKSLGHMLPASKCQIQPEHLLSLIRVSDMNYRIIDNSADLRVRQNNFVLLVAIFTSYEV